MRFLKSKYFQSFITLSGLLLLGLSISCADSASPSDIVEQGELTTHLPIKIILSEAGYYEIAIDTIMTPSEQGEVDLGKELRLSRRSTEIPYWIHHRAGKAYIGFYSSEGDSRFTNENILWLTHAPVNEDQQTSVVTVNELDEQSLAGEVDHFSMKTVNFEENLIYMPQASQTEHWFWYLLTSPHTESIEINLNGIAAGSGEINVRVAGYSDTPQAPDHHLIIRLNGQIVAEGQWDGKNEYELSGIIPDGVLKDGKNEVLIESPGDTGANVDMVMMDTIQIRYPIRLNTQSDHLLFEGNNHRLALTGFSGEVFILDITDSESPTVTGPYLPNEGEIQFQSLRGRTYLAIGPRGYKKPSQVFLDWQPDENLNVKSGADMLVISPALFGEVLQPLIELRQRQGLRVRVVPVEAIYDQYGYGFPEPEAIREFILSTQRTWDPIPRYLLIVGDATYDPRGYISTADTTMIPSFFVDTEFGGETVSDLFYAQVDEDEPPDLAVGRIPAQNIEQLRTMIEKIILYERQSLDDDWTARILAIADGQEPGFQADAEQFLSKYTDAYQTTLFIPVPGDDQSASAIEAFINDGYGVISYFGHGSVGLWGKDRLLTSEQVAQLSNPRYPIILNMTCLTGYFINPKMSSITEAFLWQADSGAVAVIAPTSLTLAADQSFLSQSFAQAQSSMTYQRLGDLFLYTQNQIPLDRVGRREVLLTYMLFGDPAMQIPQP